MKYMLCHACEMKMIPKEDAVCWIRMMFVQVHVDSRQPGRQCDNMRKLLIAKIDISLNTHDQHPSCLCINYNPVWHIDSKYMGVFIPIFEKRPVGFISEIKVI